MNTKIQSISVNALWHQIRSRPLVWNTIITTFFSTAGKSVGFLIPFCIAVWFGVSSDTDAFFFVYSVVLFLAGIFSPITESVLVPFIAELKAQDESQVGKFLGKVLVLVTIGLVFLSVIFLLLSKHLLPYVTRFPPESLQLIFRLLVETAPLFILLVGTSIFSGALNAYKIFWLPAISPVFRATIVIFAIFLLKDSLGVHSITIGYVIGEIFRLIILGVETFRRGILSLNLSVHVEPKLFEFLKKSFYQISGMVAVAFNPIVDRTMASWLGGGNVSILEYAERLYQMPLTLISSGFFVVLLSHWSEDFYTGDKRVFRQGVMSTTKIVGSIALVLTALFLVVRYPVVGLVYGHGKFPTHYLPAVTTVWSLYLLGLAPTIVGLVCARAHLVLKNTKVFMRLGILNCFLNIVLNIVLMGPFGIYGLAVSTTLSYTAVSAMLYLTFLKIKTT
ncbi:MAG: polysaccharide biosynthesis C-terminal domain-containing protein [Deltaproteobacteria bacterium]|nr:polysaccharide biosynthesis C-terminal domain-containing protein [Deltaproteobacteria bacterium]